MATSQVKMKVQKTRKTNCQYNNNYSHHHHHHYLHPHSLPSKTNATKYNVMSPHSSFIKKVQYLSAILLLINLISFSYMMINVQCQQQQRHQTRTNDMRTKRWLGSTGEADDNNNKKILNPSKQEIVNYATYDDRQKAWQSSQIPAANPNFEAAFQGECGKNNNSNPCEHICLDLHDGTYECSCFYGFTLAVDGYSCASASLKPTNIPLTLEITKQSPRTKNPSMINDESSVPKVTTNTSSSSLDFGVKNKSFTTNDNTGLRLKQHFGTLEKENEKDNSKKSFLSLGQVSANDNRKLVDKLEGRGGKEYEEQEGGVIMKRKSDMGDSNRIGGKDDNKRNYIQEKRVRQRRLLVSDTSGLSPAGASGIWRQEKIARPEEGSSFAHSANTSPAKLTRMQAHLESRTGHPKDYTGQTNQHSQVFPLTTTKIAGINGGKHGIQVQNGDSERASSAAASGRLSIGNNPHGLTHEANSASLSNKDSFDSSMKRGRRRRNKQAANKMLSYQLTGDDDAEPTLASDQKQHPFGRRSRVSKGTNDEATTEQGRNSPVQRPAEEDYDEKDDDEEETKKLAIDGTRRRRRRRKSWRRRKTEAAAYNGADGIGSSIGLTAVPIAGQQAEQKASVMPATGSSRLSSEKIKSEDGKVYDDDDKVADESSEADTSSSVAKFVLLDLEQQQQESMTSDDEVEDEDVDDYDDEEEDGNANGFEPAAAVRADDVEVKQKQRATAAVDSNIRSLMTSNDKLVGLLEESILSLSELESPAGTSNTTTTTATADNTYAAHIDQVEGGEARKGRGREEAGGVRGREEDDDDVQLLDYYLSQLEDLVKSTITDPHQLVGEAGEQQQRDHVRYSVVHSSASSSQREKLNQTGAWPEFTTAYTVNFGDEQASDEKQKNELDNLNYYYRYSADNENEPDEVNEPASAAADEAITRRKLEMKMMKHDDDDEINEPATASMMNPRRARLNDGGAGRSKRTRVKLNDELERATTLTRVEKNQSSVAVAAHAAAPAATDDDDDDDDGEQDQGRIGGMRRRLRASIDRRTADDELETEAVAAAAHVVGSSLFYESNEQKEDEDDEEDDDEEDDSERDQGDGRLEDERSGKQISGQFINQRPADNDKDTKSLSLSSSSSVPSSSRRIHRDNLEAAAGRSDSSSYDSQSNSLVSPRHSSLESRSSSSSAAASSSKKDGKQQKKNRRLLSKPFHSTTASLTGEEEKSTPSNNETRRTSIRNNKVAQVCSTSRGDKQKAKDKGRLLYMGPCTKNENLSQECESGGQCVLEYYAPSYSYSNTVSDDNSTISSTTPPTTRTERSSSSLANGGWKAARCRCPIGRGGRLCQKPVQRSVPRFFGHSYLALPMIMDPALSSLRLLFKPELAQYLNSRPTTTTTITRSKNDSETRTFQRDERRARRRQQQHAHGGHPKRPNLLLYSLKKFVLLLNDDMRRIELKYLNPYNKQELTRVIGSRDVELNKWNELIVTEDASNIDNYNNNNNNNQITNQHYNSIMNQQQQRQQTNSDTDQLQQEEEQAGAAAAAAGDKEEINRIVLVIPQRILLSKHTFHTTNKLHDDDDEATTTNGTELFVAGLPPDSSTTTMLMMDNSVNYYRQQASNSSSSSSSWNRYLKYKRQQARNFFAVEDKQSISGFTGCIRHLKINEREYNFRSDLNGDTLDGFDIGECCYAT